MPRYLGETLALQLQSICEAYLKEEVGMLEGYFFKHLNLFLFIFFHLNNLDLDHEGKNGSALKFTRYMTLQSFSIVAILKTYFPLK